MNGRRRHPRFSVVSCDAVFSVMSEVAIRQTPTGDLVVLDTEPRHIGDVVMLDAHVDGKPITTRVRVVSSRPRIKGGAVIHEVVARVDDVRLAGQQGSTLDDSSQSRERLATLTSHAPIDVMNCSAEGCLFESATSISVGTVGALSVSLGGREMNDAIQVVRCVQWQRQAPVVHRVAAKFLSITAPHAGTLRYAMRCEVGELGGWLELHVPKMENVLRFEPTRKPLFRSR